MENKKKSALLLCLFKHLVTGAPLFGVCRLLPDRVPSSIFLTTCVEEQQQISSFTRVAKEFQFSTKIKWGHV